MKLDGKIDFLIFKIFPILALRCDVLELEFDALKKKSPPVNSVILLIIYILLILPC